MSLTVACCGSSRLARWHRPPDPLHRPEHGSSRRGVSHRGYVLRDLQPTDTTDECERLHLNPRRDARAIRRPDDGLRADLAMDSSFPRDPHGHVPEPWGRCPASPRRAFPTPLPGSRPTPPNGPPWRSNRSAWWHQKTPAPSYQRLTEPASRRLACWSVGEGCRPSIPDGWEGRHPQREIGSQTAQMIARIRATGMVPMPGPQTITCRWSRRPWERRQRGYSRAVSGPASRRSWRREPR